jgi:hypothetical protein
MFSVKIQPIYFEYLSPYENFMFALKTKETRIQHPKLENAYGFCKSWLIETIEDRANILLNQETEEQEIILAEANGQALH